MRCSAGFTAEACGKNFLLHFFLVSPRAFSLPPLREERPPKAAPRVDRLCAGLGVRAAPVDQVTAVMGSNLIIVVFAVVVIGGMGSIAGAIVTGLGLGVIEGLTKVFYPQASSVSIFVIMIIVLLIKPAGLFGKSN